MPVEAKRLEDAVSVAADGTASSDDGSWRFVEMRGTVNGEELL